MTNLNYVVVAAFGDELDAMAKEAGFFRGAVGVAKGLLKKPTEAFTPRANIVGRISQAKTLGQEGLKSTKMSRQVGAVDKMTPVQANKASGAGQARANLEAARRPPTKQQLIGDLQVPAAPGTQVAKVPTKPGADVAKVPDKSVTKTPPKTVVDEPKVDVPAKKPPMSLGKKLLGVGLGTGVIGAGAGLGYMSGQDTGRRQGYNAGYYRGRQ